MALKRAAKCERHEATGVADVAAVTVRNCLRGALSGAENQLAAGALASDLPGFRKEVTLEWGWTSKRCFLNLSAMARNLCS